MKKIKSVSADNRSTMFTMVNQPPAQGGISMSIGKARDTLWDKLAGNLFNFEIAVNEINFSSVAGQDLTLNNTEFDVLLACLEDGPHVDMFQRKACIHLNKKIKKEVQEVTD